MKPLKLWFRGTVSTDRRKTRREALAGLVAFYWDGGTPLARGIREISTAGMYLLTDQRWYLGTMMTITLQRTGAADSDPDRSIAVQAKVIRPGTDGVGLTFVLPKSQNSSRDTRGPGNNAVDRKTFDQFIQRVRMDQGQGDGTPG